MWGEVAFLCDIVSWAGLMAVWLEQSHRDPCLEESHALAQCSIIDVLKFLIIRGPILSFSSGPHKLCS